VVSDSRDRTASIYLGVAPRALPLWIRHEEEVKDDGSERLHGFSWGLQRLGVVLVMALAAIMVIVAVFVVVLIGIDAAGSIGQ
jgi:hypothetical protein